MDRSLRAFWFCAILLVAGYAVFELLFSLYVIDVSAAYMPSAEAWFHFKAFEQALRGEMPWAFLWDDYNNHHLIALPKLVYIADIVLAHGSGKVVAGIAYLSVCAAAVIFTIAIFSTALCRVEQYFLSFFCIGTLCSTVQHESLVNPSNLQWAMLNASLALTGFGLAKLMTDFSRWMPRCTYAGGALSAMLCGGHIALIALTSIAVMPQLLPAAARPNSRTLAWLLSIAILLIFWELINAIYFQWHSPLLVLFYATFEPSITAEAVKLQAMVFADPVATYVQWATKIITTFAAIVTFPLDMFFAKTWLETFACVNLLILLYVMWLRLRSQLPLYGLGLFVCVIVCLLGAGASLTLHDYGLRFAGLGVLFASGFFMLLYLGCRVWRYGPILAVTTALLYSAALCSASVQNGLGMSWGSNDIRLSQVAYSMNLKVLGWVLENPGFGLLEDIASNQEQYRPVMEKYHLGAFGSQGYALYTGRDELSALTEIECENKQVYLIQAGVDLQSYRIVGQSTSLHGNEAMSDVLFELDNGLPIGYGIFYVPTPEFWQRFVLPLQWAGYAHIPDAAITSNIKAVAYNKKHRCQPFTIDLKSAVTI